MMIMHETMKYIHTFYIDMGLIWGSFFFHVQNWQVACQCSPQWCRKALLWPGRWGLWTWSHCERTGIRWGWIRTEAGSWSRQPAEPNAAVWQHVPWPARRAAAVHISASAIEVSCRAASSRTRNGVGGSISGSLQRHHSLHSLSK